MQMFILYLSEKRGHETILKNKPISIKKSYMMYKHMSPTETCSGFLDQKNFYILSLASSVLFKSDQLYLIRGFQLHINQNSGFSDDGYNMAFTVIDTEGEVSGCWGNEKEGISVEWSS